jgi:hypothetical protein
MGLLALLEIEWRNRAPPRLQDRFPSSMAGAPPPFQFRFAGELPRGRDNPPRSEAWRMFPLRYRLVAREKREGAGFPARIGSWDEKRRRSWVSSANRLVGREKAKQPTFVGELSRGARQPQGSGPIRRSWLVGRVNSQRSDGMRGFPARIGSWGEQNATEVALLGTVARGASEPSAPGVPTRLARGTGRTRRSYLSLESWTVGRASSQTNEAGTGSVANGIRPPAAIRSKFTRGLRVQSA